MKKTHKLQTFLTSHQPGLAGIIVGHPADTVKVRIQAQTPNNIRYKGTFDCFAEIIKKESVS